MKLNIDSTPTVLRSAFVAPALDGFAAGVCPQVRHRGTNDAVMATGRRPWSPLIT